jgi:hypothetical protein
MMKSMKLKFLDVETPNRSYHLTSIYISSLAVRFEGNKLTTLCVFHPQRIYPMVGGERTN